MTSRRPPRYPGLPSPDAFTGEQRLYIERLQEMIQNTAGTSAVGDPKDRVPTIRELESIGLVKATIKSQQAWLSAGDGAALGASTPVVVSVNWRDIIGAPDLCCDPIEWGDLVDIPENIKQLAALDCCGIIVRQCEANPVFAWDTALAPQKLTDVDLWTEPTMALWRYGYGLNEVDGVLKQSTLRHDVSTRYVVREYIGEVPHVRLYTRDINPETGAESNLAEGLYPLWVDDALLLYSSVWKTSAIAKIQRQQGSGEDYSRWYVNGVEGAPIRSFFDYVATPNYYHAAGSGSIWVPGFGVYSPARGEGAVSSALNFHAAPNYDSFPSGTASAGVLLTGVGSNQALLLDHDDDGNIYGVVETTSSGVFEVFSYTPALVKRWGFTISSLAGDPINSGNIRIVGNGSSLLYSRAGLVDGSIVSAYDISDGQSAQFVGTYPTFESTSNAALERSQFYNPCDGLIANDLSSLWEFCAGEVVVDPGESAQWLCREIVPADLLIPCPEIPDVFDATLQREFASWSFEFPVNGRIGAEYIDEAKTIREQTVRHLNTSTDEAHNTDVGGSNSWTRRTREITAAGVVQNATTQVIAAPENHSDLIVFHFEGSSSIQGVRLVSGGLGITDPRLTHWYVDGALTGSGVLNIPVAAQVNYRDSFGELGASGIRAYVEGDGIYILGMGLDGVASAAFVYYPVTNGIPATTPTAWYEIDPNLSSYAGKYLGRDVDRNVYFITERNGAYKIWKFAPRLASLIFQIDLPATRPHDSTAWPAPSGGGNNVVHNGRYVTFPAGLSSSTVDIYDISNGTSLVYVTTLAFPEYNFGRFGRTKQLNTGCEIYLPTATDDLGRVFDMGVCDDCVEVGGNPRLTVTNGRGQGGDIILDLATVEQGVGGELRARTVDAWGRVVENRAVVADDIPPLPYEPELGNPAEDGYVLSSTVGGVRSWVEQGGGGVLPMTTGEVPPVLVYGPDGSLIYFEV